MFQEKARYCCLKIAVSTQTLSIASLPAARKLEGSIRVHNVTDIDWHSRSVLIVILIQRLALRRRTFYLLVTLLLYNTTLRYYINYIYVFRMLNCAIFHHVDR